MVNNLINDSTFWYSMATLIIGSIAVTIRACYKSKCSDFKCRYGLISIERNVDVEEHIDMERNDSNRDFIPRSEN